MLAQEVVNKLSNNVAVVKIKKRGYTGSYVKTKNLVEIVEDKQKKRLKQLMTHFQRWRLRHWRTHRVKNCKR